MKKIYLILAIVFLYSSNSVFAQGHHDTYEWEQHIANINHRQFFGESKSYRKPMECYKLPPKIFYMKPVETITDETTGNTTIRWADGAMYRGQTYYGEIKGVGTMVYPDGSKYCGTWERDLPNGQGTFQTAEGILYTVNFENGLPHGKGIIQDLDGRKYSARWVHGEFKEGSIKPLEE